MDKEKNHKDMDEMTDSGVHKKILKKEQRTHDFENVTQDGDDVENHKHYEVASENMQSV